MDVLEEHGKKYDYDPIGDVQVLYVMQQGKQIQVMCGQEAAETWGRMLGCVLCSLDGERSGYSQAQPYEVHRYAPAMGPAAPEQG